MMPYGVLAHCDFFGSIMAFWVTLMAMSKLTYRLKAFFYMLAALGLAIGVTWDRHSLYTFLVPTATGVIIMIISWVSVDDMEIRFTEAVHLITFDLVF